MFLILWSLFFSSFFLHREKTEKKQRKFSKQFFHTIFLHSTEFFLFFFTLTLAFLDNFLASLRPIACGVKCDMVWQLPDVVHFIIIRRPNENSSSPLGLLFFSGEMQKYIPRTWEVFLVRSSKHCVCGPRERTTLRCLHDDDDDCAVVVGEM